MNVGSRERNPGKLIGLLVGLAILAVTSCQALATSLNDGVAISGPALSISAEGAEGTLPPSATSAYVAATLDTIIHVGFTGAGDNVPPFVPATNVEPVDGLTGQTLTRFGTLSYSGGGLFNFPIVPEPEHLPLSNNPRFWSTAVPEPPTLWLVSSAFVGVAVASSKRRGRTCLRPLSKKLTEAVAIPASCRVILRFC